MTNPKAAILGLAAACFLYPSLCGAEVAATASDHAALRNDTAAHHTTPVSHLRLAQHHYALSNKVQAFYIAEYARRMFGDDDFTPAFHDVAAVKLITAYARTNEAEMSQYAREHPDSLEGRLLAMDQLLKERPKSKQAVQALEALLDRYPRHVGPKAVAARYFNKVNRDEVRALDLYIDLYFFDPHYYDGEYAEFRIKQIVSDHRESWWKARNKRHVPLKQWVTEEKNPRVLDGVIEQARSRWEASLAPVMLAMMDNDDPSIQSAALHTLLAHPRDVSKSEISAILKGDDLVKRGMAAFLLVKCVTNADFTTLQDNLNSGVELVQIDTIQALGQISGASGLNYLKAHMPSNMTPRVSEIWQGQIARGEPGGAANGSQPIRSETNSTSSAAGSRR
jgi:hypothetical protein